MPKTTVAALITMTTNGTEHVLLTQRAVLPFQHHWCLPGGLIEPYERAHDAIIREVQEETGLAFDARFFAYFDEIIPPQEIHAVVLVFTGRGAGTMTEPGSPTRGAAPSAPGGGIHAEVAPELCNFRRLGAASLSVVRCSQ